MESLLDYFQSYTQVGRPEGRQAEGAEGAAAGETLLQRGDD